MRTEFYAAINRLVEEGPNPAEFLLALTPSDLSVEAVDRLLGAWAAAYTHRLRPRERRNPLVLLNRNGVCSRLVDGLTRDIVFNTRGFEEHEATDMAKLILDQLAVVDAAAISFPIEDWTMSEVVLIRGERHVLLLAFLGED